MNACYVHIQSVDGVACVRIYHQQCRHSGDLTIELARSQCLHPSVVLLASLVSSPLPSTKETFNRYDNGHLLHSTDKLVEYSR